MGFRSCDTKGSLCDCHRYRASCCSSYCMNNRVTGHCCTVRESRKYRICCRTRFVKKRTGPSLKLICRREIGKVATFHRRSESRTTGHPHMTDELHDITLLNSTNDERCVLDSAWGTRFKNNIQYFGTRRTIWGLEVGAHGRATVDRTV
jgi:hypothetical protein